MTNESAEAAAPTHFVSEAASARTLNRRSPAMSSLPGNTRLSLFA